MCRSFPRKLSCLWEGGCSDYIQCDEDGARTDRWAAKFYSAILFQRRRRRIAPPSKYFMYRDAKSISLSRHVARHSPRGQIVVQRSPGEEQNEPDECVSCAKRRGCFACFSDLHAQSRCGMAAGAFHGKIAGEIGGGGFVADVSG